jgi:3-oxoacyl-[acyl-carrier protein] reductase
MKTALVFGGSGAVGQEVVRALSQARLSVVFTFHQQQELAQQLSQETGARALAADFSDEEATRDLVQKLSQEEPSFSVFVHCAAVSQSLALSDISPELWRRAWAVNCHAAFWAAQALAPHMQQGGEIILLGAIDRAQSLPAPVHFAATQGALSTMTVALAKELGPKVRVNLLALGILERGLSRGLSPKHLAEFQSFSALRRVGRPSELAQVVRWLATENYYLSGKTIPVNGGI